MKPVLTPKTLAEAIGVSESSLRRWVDSGAIPTSRTVGGHRRIALADAIRFIRTSNATIVRPELLGLAELSHRYAAGPNEGGDDEKLFSALCDGSLPRARGIVLSLYMTGASLPGIFDGPMRAAVHRVGELWKHEQAGILVEHRATDLCLQIVSEIRQTLPAVDGGAPVAMGGAPSGDPYLLPSMMAATVLADEGYREINFGAQTPVSLLPAAAREHGARLVWLSFSAPVTDEVVRQVEAIYQPLARLNCALVLGGRHAAEVQAPEHPLIRVATSMAELSAFAQGLRTAVRK